MIQLTSENYFSQQANLDYMSCSQFKSFCDCEERTLADIAGDYKRDSSTALLVGSYVDAHFEGTLDVSRLSTQSCLSVTERLKLIMYRLRVLSSV